MNLLRILYDDPGKVESNFFCYAAMCFPHIGEFSFYTENAKQKGRLRDEMYLPIIRVANNSQEKFTISLVPHIGFLCYSDWDEI